MTPEQFLIRIKKQSPSAVYLFLGPEAYQRRVCKDAILDRILPGEARLDGFMQFDLEETSLAQVLDHARSLSLFAPDRVIWASSAEAALPRRLSAASGEEEDSTAAGSEDPLKAYLNDPTPGTTLVFECSRYEFSGDDKARLDRVARFYSAIPDVVEFRPFTPEGVRALAHELIEYRGLQIGAAELSFLLDAIGGDAMRLGTELEKLLLFAGTDRKVTVDDLQALVPNASQANIFVLVNSLGRKDRRGALRALDLLVRDGEYLPLALWFLGTQFRLALAAQEAGLKSAQQALAYFSKQGVRIWRDRAEQVIGTAGAFRRDQLERGLELFYETDKGLRDIRPDDRTVVEKLIVDLTTK